MIKGVIFDWNGTLSDDTKRIYSVAMKTAKKVGGQPISFNEFRRKVRNPWYPFYRDDLGCRVPKPVINKWFCYYLKQEKIPARLFPDSVSLLRFLHSQGIEIGIVSSYPEESLLAEVKKHGIGDYIHFVRGSCHTKDRHIRDFLKLNKIKPKEAIFVGDMVFDVLEGKKCRVITAAYLKGADNREKLLTSKPDILLKTLNELKKLC
jgi:phosphoglycolate phosphatase